MNAQQPLPGEHGEPQGPIPDWITRKFDELNRENERLKELLAIQNDPGPEAAIAEAKLIIADEGRRRFEARKAGKAPLVEIRGGAFLNGYQPPAVEWVLPGVFPEGLTYLVGGPKAGKSWLSLAVSLAAADGSPVLGGVIRQPPRPVLCMALEDSDRRLKQRAAQLGWDRVPEGFEYVTRATPDQTFDTAWNWLCAHRGQRPLIVIDTWGKIAPPAERGETTYGRDYRLGTKLQQLAEGEPGTSVWVLHHSRKQGADDFIDMVSGTQGVAGSADTIVLLVRRRGEDKAMLRVTGRDVDENDYQLTGFPVWQLDGGSPVEAARAAQHAAARQSTGGRSNQILDKIEQEGQITTAEAAQMLGVAVETAGAYLSRLASSGKIARISRGVYASLVSSVESAKSVENLNTLNGLNTGYVREEPDDPDWPALWQTAFGSA